MIVESLPRTKLRAQPENLSTLLTTAPCPYTPIPTPHTHAAALVRVVDATQQCGKVDFQARLLYALRLRGGRDQLSTV
jgi:hypothetical protein